MTEWRRLNQVSMRCGGDGWKSPGQYLAVVCDDFTRPWKADKPRFWIHNADGTSDQNLVLHPPIERCLTEAFCELIRTGNAEHDWLMLSLRTQLV